MEDDGDASSHLDQMFWDEGLSGSNAWSNYMFRLKGYFIPPRDGEYKFTISRSDDDSTLFFSQSGNASDLVSLNSYMMGNYEKINRVTCFVKTGLIVPEEG